jgi:hypothetical protein
VIAVGADRDRGLGALKLGMLGSRGPTNRAAAIPLRNATTCRGAQDDDAKHDPSLLEIDFKASILEKP